MKKSHILALIVIAVSVGIIVSTAGDASSYVSFDKAKSLAKSGNNSNIHVVGELPRDMSGEIYGIEKSEDLLSFSFVMIDSEGNEQKVYYPEPMPADFQRSEQVVVVGSYKQEDIFVADKILMKCPSKYQEEYITAEVDN